MAWTDWLECWGTYDRSSAPYNVALGGSPSESLHGLNLGQAKAGGFGQGIRFEPHENGVNVELSLIGYSITDQLKAVLNGQYVRGAFTYDWLVDWYYSTDGGNSYKTGNLNVSLASHASDQNLAYGANWHLSTAKKTFSVVLPKDFTHFKIEVKGERPMERHQNIYTRPQIIKDYIPLSIRKSNGFISLDNKGILKVRKSGRWLDQGKHNESHDKQENHGSNRIRKSGRWLQQVKQ